jgi:hypothetical protein
MSEALLVREPHTKQTRRFVEGLREPDTAYISPKRLSSALGVPAQGMAELAGIHRNTLRNPASDRLQGRLREIVKALVAAADLTGDVKKAAYWYRNEPIGDYGYRTAAELVAEGQLQAVLAYLADLADGAAG